MASSSDMKGFFKQKKKSGITKPTQSKKTTQSKKPLNPKNSASYGSDVVQPPALISHGSLDLKDEYDANEEVLRQFDMNMAYGPCIGMGRLARWERAKALGMNPPKEVGIMLGVGKVNYECLWEGRV